MADEQLRAAQMKYRLGWARVRIDNLTLGDNLPVPIRERWWNKREQKPAGIAQLWTTGFNEGKEIYSTNPTNAIIISINKDFIKVDKLAKDTLALKFPVLEFTRAVDLDTREIGDVINGLHRIYAVQQNLLKDLLKTKEILQMEQAELDPLTPKGQEKMEIYQRKLELIEMEMNDKALWLCEIYDFGRQLSQWYM